jgi:hypothetical protein
VANEIKAIASSEGTGVPAAALEYGRTGRRKVNWWLFAGDAFALALAWLLSFGLLWLFGGQLWRQGVIGWWADWKAGVMLSVGLFAVALLLSVRGATHPAPPVFDRLWAVKVLFVVAVLDAVSAYLAKSYFSRPAAHGRLLVFMLVPAMRAVKCAHRAGRWPRR